MVATLKKQVKITGKGIHSGLPVNMVVRPSEQSGIFFHRTDIPESGLIPATYDNVGDTSMRNTTIGNPNGAHVQTIEHLMAALFMAGIVSVILDIMGSETPNLDGRAEKFYNGFFCFGITGNRRRKDIL